MPAQSVRVEERRHAPAPMNDFVRLDVTKAVTNKQLAEAYNTLHDCVHTGFKETRDDIRHLSAAVLDDRKEMRANFREIKQAVGADRDDGKPRRKRVSDMSQVKAILTLTGAALGAAVAAAGLYKYAFPAVEAFFVTLHHSLMGG